MDKPFIYADCAATVPVTDRALAAAEPYFRERFGNASSIHTQGMGAARALLDARKRVAAQLEAEVSEIYFTSGGTEADNWALRGGAALGAVDGRRHIVTTNAEHPAVLRCCEALAREGYEVTYLPVNSEGFVTPEQVADALRSDTALVSVMYANNEIGTLSPVHEIAQVCRSRGVLFHTDAVQAAGHEPIDLGSLGADMLSLSGHKLGAMKGVGALYIRKGIELPPLICGGGQERGRRSGTENIPAVISLAEALAESLEGLEDKNARLLEQRERLTDGLLSIPGSRLNGSLERRLAGNVNVSFEGIESESLLIMLDMRGICASGGSACSSYTNAPSHVLTAIGTPESFIKGSLRLSFGILSDVEVEYIIAEVAAAVEKLRRERFGA